jgi:S1-C subfamily serine protease
LRRLILIGAAIISWTLGAWGQARAGDLALPSESILARSQASVFLIVSYADYNVTIPKKVDLVTGPDGVPLVFADYETFRASGRIKPGDTKHEFCWSLMVANLERYLKITVKESKQEPMEVRGSGTAFAVSKEGILVTNAHNVIDPADGELPIHSLFPVLDRTIDELSGVTAAGQIIGRAGVAEVSPSPFKPGGNTFPELAKALDENRGADLPPRPSLGGRPPEAYVTPLIRGLFTWLQDRSSSTNNKFRQVVVVMDYRDKSDADKALGLFRPALNFRAGSLQTQRALQGLHDDMVLIELMSSRAVARFATVLIQGDPMPGKDVAVLKLGLGPRGVPADAMICLTLGDSDRVRLGSNVLALGFPGAAFDPEIMKQEARYRVITEDGKITQRIPYKSGVDFFHMTAQINHGHSGGPVVDQYGRVVAINVAKVKDNIRIAVPINVAREFLDRAGIKPDPGPVTQRWLAAHDLFEKGSYAEAERAFTWVADRQSPDRNRPAAVSLPGLGSEPANSYVEAMIRECRARAAKR